MTTEEKMKILKNMSNEELLEAFRDYAGKDILGMDEGERKTYMLVKTELLYRMAK